MALNPATVELIRYEIGPDTDVADDSVDEGTAALGISLETIYTNANAGQSNVLITSLIVWRTRPHCLAYPTLSHAGSLLRYHQGRQLAGPIPAGQVPS
jgi:hypothetical protein